MLSFIAHTQDGKVQYRDNLNQVWVEEDRRRVARVTEVHIYTEEEVARELELKARYSVHQEEEDSLPFSITVSL